ncbi:hypothetical protein FKM82_004743 [Ascaphus truei]
MSIDFDSGALQTQHEDDEEYDKEDYAREQERFIASEGTSNQPVESIQVKYNPYQLNVAHKNLVNQDTAKRGDHFDEMQREFLDTGESSSNSMQFVQLQVLYKARGRQLDGLNDKFEESGRQIRYLNHQLAIVKDEKDGLAISLQESHTLFQNAREREIQLEGQMKALEKTVECLTTNEEHLRKELKVAKVAMESMQQQVLDLRRSDSIQRAREQHEAIVSVLKKKSEEQVLALQQKLDEVHSALLEQKELCCRLEDQVKRAERNQEESKLEKTEIINRLTRSLEECQKQCANLLHTGSIQEATGLRLQLQQVLSSKNISDAMNKALQEEVTELKEHITLYESAAKMGVFINNGEQEDLSDSYVDLGIKKVNWQKTRFQRAMRNKDIRKDLSTEEIAIELKAELERSLNSNKTKRHQIVQLQTDLKGYRSKTEELEKLLEKAEKTARGFEVIISSLSIPLKQKDPVSPYGHVPSETLKEDIQKLKSDKDMLQQEVEKHLMCIKKLEANEEKLRAANQELCNEMRGMVQDFDNDKQDAVERCERTYEKHHEDIRNSLRMELSEKFSSEKEQLCQTYEENISQLQSRMNEMSHELTAVQECYIAVCKEKDTLEDSLRENLKKELQINEQKSKIDELKFQLQDALQEKERLSVRPDWDWKFQHNEDISKQVKLTLYVNTLTVFFHVRWLQEITSFFEYKAHLSWRKKRRMKINELNVKKQISDALLRLREEDWKKRAGKADFNVNQKELEKRCLHEQRAGHEKEEFQARLKVEQAKARAQWKQRKARRDPQDPGPNEKRLPLIFDELGKNETAAETLRKENVELHNKLEEMKATITASFQPQEGYENALEEMRAQYIKAVDKIKNDMLRYIHESKVRAAEMLKSEVLRERQETARKMRKYYLTCLQQLLKDDGKNEGAEKKIMNAASKLATMAKVLETPISQKSQSKNLQTAAPLSKAVLPETEQDKSDSLKTVPSWASNRSKDQNIDQMTIDQFMKRRVPINLKDQPEGSKIPDTAALTIGVKSSDCASMQFRKDLLKQERLRCPDVRHSQTQVLHSMNSQCVMHTPEEQIHSFGCIDSNADSVHVKLRGQGEPSFLQGIKGCHRERPKITSDSQRFDLQETPVRDESGSNDHSAFSGKNVFSSQPGQCSFTNLHIQPQVSITSENFATASVCSVVEGSRDLFGSDCEVQNYSAHIAKRKYLHRDTEHSNKILGLPPPTIRLNPDSKPYSGSTRPSRKLLLELTSLQQDSGFDSPFLNFNNFN